MSILPSLEKPMSCLGNSEISKDFLQIRELTRQICRALRPDDFGIQTMEEVSPPKWHLAHTTWFFETFILEKFKKNYRTFHQDFSFLFNSYYKGIGNHTPRHSRGLMSRPELSKILQYRSYVNDQMMELLDQDLNLETLSLIILGLHHEQQHQELLFTDIKHILATQPFCPPYQDGKLPEAPPPDSLAWCSLPEGLVSIGFEGKGFAFDNERPRHKHFLESYQLGHRLITNGEFLDFLQSGAYQEPLLWLSDGWDWIQRHKIAKPLYWEIKDGEYFERTLYGLIPLDRNRPLMHVNYYEADAFAHWAHARLPTEGEWEFAAQKIPVRGNFMESGLLHVTQSNGSPGESFYQLFGDVWEWTASPYSPYPRFKPNPGAVGEYNGKFMCNQMVIRGGSCFSPQKHIRPTYRNFFYPQARWQATGIRLARNNPV